MVLLFAVFWIVAFGDFVIFLSQVDTLDANHLLGTLMFCVLPVLLSLDVAAASSDCKGILMSLNNTRLEATLDLDVDAKVQVLERAITTDNRGEGLGFVAAGGKVWTSSTLKAVIIRRYLRICEHFHSIRACSEATSGRLEDVYECALTVAQSERVRAAMLHHNRSCIYNQSLQSILSAGHLGQSRRLVLQCFAATRHRSKTAVERC